jgi:hypothetical protein
VLTVASLLGCAPSSVLLKPAEPLTAAWAIGVYPVTFRFPVSPYESFVRGRALADQLSRKTNLVIYGPGEFRVINVDDDDARHGSTLTSAVRYGEHRPPEGLYAVRVIVNRLIQQSEGALMTDTEGRVRGIVHASATEDVTVREELLSVTTHGVIAEIEQKVKVDMLKTAGGEDPFPDITALSSQMLDLLIKTAGLPANRKPSTAGLVTVPVLFPALNHSANEATSLQSELSKLDAIDVEARTRALMRRADPTASRARQRLYQAHVVGLVVTQVSGSAGAGLQPDDLILTVDYEPVFGQYALERHLADGPCTLHVRRGATEMDVTLTPQASPK